ncbi:carboxypeptidase Q-like [Dermacentor albipictus]|uniref:carboxypeptidase Q-like n=1 Tax=Dermacentor albipictus TaxID=60249 RepID=UPI0038FD27D4
MNPVLPLLLSVMFSKNSPATDRCDLPSTLVDEIDGYGPVVRRILSAFDDGPQSGSTYRALAEFADRFGHRLVGSESLEAAIDNIVASLRAAGLDRVETEPVDTPVWQRGRELAQLVEPRPVPLDVLGLGGSVATPAGGLTAPVLAVRSFEELDRRRAEVNGTIVLFNPEWTDYWRFVPYRTKGPSYAARYGAVAALVRSATPASLYTPHTGMLKYLPEHPKIPAAAVTVEDAELLTRLVERGSNVVVHLEMSNNHTQGVSRNIVADITGSVFPEQYVIVGAHTDSWDVGQGVVDDAGGVFIFMTAMAQLRRMQLRPRRTLRLVLWTAEEVGLYGATEFVRRHRDEMDAVSLALESDIGTFAPVGLTTSGGDNTTACILRRLLSLTAPVGATRLEPSRGRGSDVSKLEELGVPVSVLLTRNERYFHYHHTRADTVSAVSSRDLDLCAAFVAAVAYAVADLRDMLPRGH